MNEETRLPPHSTDAEKAVIGTVLLTPGVIDDFTWLPAKAFYHQHHQLIWAAILSANAEGIRIDENVVKVRLQETGRYAEFGGDLTLYDIADSVGDPGVAKDLAKTIEAYAAIRSTLRASLEVVEKCYAPGVPQKILRAAEVRLAEQMSELAVHVKRKRTVTLEEACRGHLERINQGTGPLIASGLSELDAALGGGVALGEMVVIGARPSMGKTMLALQWLEAVASLGQSCLLVSEEMSIDAIGRRGLQRLTTLEEKDWKDHSNMVASKIAQHFNGSAPVYVAESLGSTAAACLEIDRLCANKGVKAVAVDYAQLLRGRGESRYEQVTNTSQDLKQCATRNNVLLILLAQLSRKIEERNDQTPVLSDLRESGQLEQDADVVLFLQWPWKMDPEEPQERYRIFQAKNRNRGVRKPMVEVEIDASRQTFRNMALGESFNAYSGWSNDNEI